MSARLAKTGKGDVWVQSHSQFSIIWMIDKFGWFENYDTSGIITAQDS